MKNKCVLLLWALVFGNILLQAESALKITFIDDLCYNSKKSVIDLRYESSGILMSAPSINAPDSFECEVLLRPPPGASVVLSIFRYDLRDGDQLIIEDSDRHRIALMGWGSFKYEKKSIISEGKMTVLYKTNNNTSALRRTGFQFTYTKVMNSPCASNEFKCDNGKCVLKEYICDGHNHCGDRSDQTKCGLDDSNKSTPGSRTNKSILFLSLIIVASVILFIIIIVFIVFVVRGMKLKKAIANNPNVPIIPTIANNPNVSSSPANNTNTIPLQSVSSSVHQAVQAPMASSAPVQHSQVQMASAPVHGTRVQMASAPVHDTQVQAASAPPVNDTPPNSFYNRVRRSLRRGRSQSRSEDVQEQARAEPYQVPSMYPSLELESNDADMYGVENPDFKIEE